MTSCFFLFRMTLAIHKVDCSTASNAEITPVFAFAAELLATAGYYRRKNVVALFRRNFILFRLLQSPRLGSNTG